MKVIRLVEAEYEQTDSGLFIPKVPANNGQSQANNQENNYTNLDANAVMKAFESKKATFGDKAGIGAINVLNKFLKNMQYNGLSTDSLVKNILPKYDFKFIKYFLECLGYENLGDKTNKVLTALSNQSAVNVLNGNKSNFTKLYNVANDKDISAKYLANNDAIIYDRNFYNIPDQESIDNIVQFDSENIDKPEVRQQLRDNLAKGNYGQFKPSTARNEKEKASIETKFNNLSKKDKTDVLTNITGLNKNDISKIVDKKV